MDTADKSVNWQYEFTIKTSESTGDAKRKTYKDQISPFSIRYI